MRENSPSRVRLRRKRSSSSVVLPMAVLWRELPGRVTGDGDTVAPGPAEAVAVGATSTA